MKTKRFLMLMVICITTVILGFAESKNQPVPNSQKNGSCILRLERKGSKVKRMPSQNFIELVYENSTLYAESPNQEGLITLSFRNCENNLSAQIFEISVGESMVVDLDYGIYEVSAEGSDGILYYGEIVIH